MGKLRLKEWKFLAKDLTADTGRIQIHVCLMVQESLSKHCFYPTACAKIIRTGGMWHSHQLGSGMSPWVPYGWMRVSSQLSVPQKGSDKNQRGQLYLWEEGNFLCSSERSTDTYISYWCQAEPCGAPGHGGFFCPPFHVGKTPASMIFSEFQRSKWSEVAQSCLILWDPVDCSLPGSSIHGIFQARVLEWVAISFYSRSSQSRDRSQVSSIVGWHFTIWVTREVLQRSEQLLIKKGATRKPSEIRLKKPERLLKISWLTT